MKKVLGLAVGERSLAAAEVVLGKRPVVARVGELTYAPGVSPAEPAELGKALAKFLRDGGFTARAAVVGLPARWLVVKPKEVPPADPATLAEMLRLQAEGEFSAELKDLVCDFVADPSAGVATTVLLVATSRKHVDNAVEACAAAKLDAATVTSTALALGEATGRALGGDALVLAIGSASSELTVQRGAVAGAVRALRGAEPRASFGAELRRTVLTLPSAKGPRTLYVWGGVGLDADAIGARVGVSVRVGDLPALGVDIAPAAVNGDPNGAAASDAAVSAAANGHGGAYAAAVALALLGSNGPSPSVDFLHSRLAPPKVRRLPRWAALAAVAAVAAVAGGVYAYADLQRQQAALDADRRWLAENKEKIAAADAFVSKVSFAQAWHGGQAQYLACLRDLTAAFPEDGLNYATSLVVHENIRPPAGSGYSAGGNGYSAGGNAPSGFAGAKSSEAGALLGTLYGRSPDQQRATLVLDRMKRLPAFADVKLGGTQGVGRAGEVSFSIAFTYVPPPRAAR